MTQTNRVEFARQSFAANRRVAEEKLAEAREYIQHLRGFRHDRAAVGSVMRFIMFVPYLWEKRKMVLLLQEIRWRIRFYRRVEADLKRGDLGSAIEALSLFAPREETTTEIVRRVQSSPVTVWAIQQSPTILRENMLRLRDDLIKVQQERTC